MTTLRTLLAAALLSACAAAAGERCPAGFTPGADGRCAPVARDATAEPANTRPARASEWSDAGAPSTWAPPDATEPGSDVRGATTATDAATPDCPWQQRVRLSEVLFDPAGDDAPDEFVELSGPAGAPLEGMQLIATNGATGALYLTLALEGVIGARGLWVAGGEAVVSRALTLPGTLQNGPDAIALIDCAGALVDALAYGEGAEGGEGAPARVGAGQSAMRCGSDDTDDNAADFVAGIPTPGAPNEAVDGACHPDACVGLAAGAVLLNEVRYDPPGADGAGEREFVEIYARSGAQTEGVALYLINGSDGRPYAEPVALPAWEGSRYLVAGGEAVAGRDVVLSGPIQNGPDALALVDCTGHVLDALAYGDAPDGLGEGPPAADVSGEGSLGRRNGGDDLNHNAADFVAFETATPGAPNAAR